MKGYKHSLKVVNFLSQGSFIQINLMMIKNLGLESAYLLSHLITKWQDFDKFDKLQEDGTFWQEQTKITKDIGFSAHKQNKMIEQMESFGLIKIYRRGSPPMNYFDIKFEKISELMNYGELHKLENYKKRIKTTSSNRLKSDRFIPQKS